MRAICVLLSVIVIAKAMSATTYYVSEDTGSDSYTDTQAQDPNTPWATIENAVQTCDGTSPITIYVKLPTDNTFNEPDSITTDVSCNGKDVTIEGYTTSPGDGAAGCVPLDISTGYAAFQIGTAHLAGTLSFKYLDIIHHPTGSSQYMIRILGTSNQTGITFDSCTLNRSAETSARNEPLTDTSLSSAPATPTRDLTFTNCVLLDYSAGSHTVGLIDTGEWDVVTFDQCTFSGAPSGGLCCIVSLTGTINTLAVSNCTSTITHNSANGFGVMFGSGIENVSSISITDTTFADSAFQFNDVDEGPGVTIFRNNTVVASGTGFYIGLPDGDPAAAYGLVYLDGNTFEITSESGADYGAALLKGLTKAYVSYTTIVVATGVEWPLTVKSDACVNHCVVESVGRPVVVSGGTTIFSDNTVVQTSKGGFPCLDLYSNTDGPEDVWPQYCVITNNIFDAGAGSECLRMYDNSATWDPPDGMYRTVVNNNLYIQGEDGLATIFSIDCGDADDGVAMAELRAAWATYESSGTLAANDSGSEVSNRAGFVNKASGVYRIAPGSQAVSWSSPWIHKGAYGLPPKVRRN